MCVEATDQPRGRPDGGVDVTVMAEAGGGEASGTEATGIEAAVPGDVSMASANLTADPERLDFGVIAVGGPTASEILRVVNAGPSATGELRVEMQGTSDFEVVITDCVATLPPMQACRVNVSYAPRNAGPASALLRVLAEPGGELLVALGGSGRHCGDGQRDRGEDCDGLDLDGQTCGTLGFDGGTLVCDGDCKLDRSTCTKCGNGVIEGDEECEGKGSSADFGGRRCRDYVYRGSGALSCSRCQVDSGGCQTEPY